MSWVEHLSRPRGARGMLLLGVIALVVFPLAVALLLVVLAGMAMLVAGLSSWLHPADVAAAWARTLGGIGLVGGGAGLLGMMGLAIGAFVGRESSRNHELKFAAVIAILLALVCLPFAAAIGAHIHVSWFG